MKRIIIIVISIMISICAYGQKDTTIINYNTIDFSYETTISKTGKVKTEYLVNYRGSWYVTDKTSYNRYITAKRFNLYPNVAIVTDKKTKAKKIIVI